MTDQPAATSVKVYKYRWVILLIFCLYSCVNGLQFLQYAIISNITRKYYKVDNTLVSLTSLFYMITFVVFCLPVNYLTGRYSLRFTAIVTTALTTIGNLIKLGSASPDRFYLVMIGQFLCASAQGFLLSIPSKLASTWFGPEEVSTACAIAIFGIQMGGAIGGGFSSGLVRNSDDLADIGDDFFTMAIINTSLTCATFVLVLLFFRAKPKLPPSRSQVTMRQVETPSLSTTAKSMVKSKNYLLLLAGLGSTSAVYMSFGILISGVYVNYFPGSEQEIGIINTVSGLVGGCFGSVVFGYILDRWHRFKLTSIFVIMTAAVGYIFVAYTMEVGSKIGTYFTIPIFGFFIASSFVVGFEFATEIMYPLPETASCSVFSCFLYLLTIPYTLALNVLFDTIGYIATHSIIVGILVLSSSFIYFISPTLRRREANIQ